MEFTSEITVDLVDTMGDDNRVVSAAQASTKGKLTGILPDDKKAGLINFLMKKRHGTPFEHGCMTFTVTAPIFVWREHHRHRIGFSYNEESGRYKQLEPIFWIPKRERAMTPVPDPGSKCTKILDSGPVCAGTLEKLENGLKICPYCGTRHEYHAPSRPKFGPASDEAFNRFLARHKVSCAQSYAAYEESLKDEIAKEVARVDLPVAIFSTCWVTFNPRSLMSFLSLRTHEAESTFVSYPQAEIEEVARAYEAVFAERWPLTYKAFQANGRVAP